MSEPRVLLDPTAEGAPEARERVPRPASLAGLTVGLLSISKKSSDVFLDELDRVLTARGLKTERFRKPTFARPAPLALRQDMATRVDVAIEALAD